MRQCCTLLAALWLGTAGSLAGAQTVHRCGNTYTERPCANGDQIEVRDERSEAQRAEALEAQRRQREAADQLARERRDFEAQPVAAGGIHGVQAGQAEEEATPKPRSSKRTTKRKRRKTETSSAAGLRRSADGTVP